MATPNSNTHAARANSRRALIIVATLALLGLAYALIRVDVLRARIVTLDISLQAMQRNNEALAERITTLASNNETHADQQAQLQRELGRLSDMGDLRTRAEQAQQLSVRGEALYLLRLAQQQLQLAHDIGAATSTLNAADKLLHSQPGADTDRVTQQVSTALAQLRSLPIVDVTDIQQQLSSAAQQSTTLPLTGIVLNSTAPPATGTNVHGWNLIKQRVQRLFALRKTSAEGSTLLDEDTQLLRRRHLQLLLLDARLASTMHNQSDYRQALTAAGSWLQQAFDMQNPAAQQMQQQLTRLATLNLAPATPDLAASITALNQELERAAVTP